MLVRADGSIMGTIGGGNIEEQAISEAVAAMRTGKTKRLAFRLTEDENTEWSVEATWRSLLSRFW